MMRGEGEEGETRRGGGEEGERRGMKEVLREEIEMRGKWINKGGGEEEMMRGEGEEGEEGETRRRGRGGA